ncbi:MAG: T9SS type A sorting domain-containing protein [Bacteroidota bacterium]
MQRFLRLALAVLFPAFLFAAALSPAVSFAQCSISWAEPDNGVWSDATNWAPARVPGIGDQVCITTPGTYIVTLNASAEAGELTVGSGSMDGEQRLRTSGGNVNLTLSGDLRVQTGGRFDFSYLLDVSGSVSVNGGLLRMGSATATVFRSDGPVEVAAAGELSVQGTLAAPTVLNNGLLRITERLTIEDGTVLDNRGELIHEGGGGGRSIAGDGELRNSGTLRKVNRGSVPIQVPLTNTGALVVEEDNILIEAPSTHTGATLTVADDKLLRFQNGATHTFTTVTLGGTGTIEVNGTTTLDAPDLEIPAGLTFELSSGATFNGGDALTVHGTLETGFQTTLTGTGMLSVAEGGFVELRSTLDGWTLANTGTVDVTEGLTLQNAEIVNDGTLILSASTRAINGTGRVVNRSDARKTSRFFFELAVPFVNEGPFDIEDGSLTITDVFENTEAGTLRGVGTLSLFNGTFENAGTVAPGLSPGRLQVAGTYPNGDGTLAIELGGTTAQTEYDVLGTATASLDGTLNVAFIDGFAPQPGDTFTPILGQIEGTFAQFDGLVAPENGVTLYPSVGDFDQGFLLTTVMGVPTLGPSLTLETPVVETGAPRTLTLSGSGFAPDATFRLVCNGCADPVGAPEIPLGIRSMGPDLVEVVADLSAGGQLGTYDVVAEDPRGGRATGGPLTIAPGPLTIALDVTTPEAAEDGRVPGVVTLRTNFALATPVVVPFSLGGTATPFADYVTSTTRSTVTIPAGARSVDLLIFPRNDANADDGETVIVTLLPDASYTLGSTSRGTVTIADGSPSDAFDVFYVTPTTAGSEGTAFVRAVGQGFAEGASIELRNGGTVLAPQYVETGADQVAGSFDLTGAPTGTWDVVVTSGSGPSETLAAAFTIEDAVAPDLWVDVGGPPAVRPGRLARYSVSVTNRGNADAVLVPLYISLQKDPRIDAALEPLFDLGDLNAPPGFTDFGSWEEYETVLDTLDQLIYPLVLPLVPPGETVTLDFLAITPQLSAWTADPMLLSFPSEAAAARLAPEYAQAFASALQSSGTSDTVNCVYAILSSAADIVLDFIPGVGCIRSAEVFLGKIFLDSISGAMASTEDQRLAYMSQLLVSIGGLLLDCGAEFIPALKAGKAILKTMKVLLTGGAGVASVAANCGPVMDRFFGVSHDARIVASIDPNDKLGPSGAGDARYVNGRDPFNYQIRFENKPEATAPALEVIVVDTLDTSRFDLDTFTMGTVYFGEWSYTPPPGLSAFTTTLDLRPANSLLVQVDAVLDRATGIATWRFTGLDPATGALPEDPFAGFLPPNNTPPEGDGGVFFRVATKDDLPSGSVVTNEARIFFDLNEPIDTPLWSNTLDSQAPTSTVEDLADEQTRATFPVSWTGADDAAGVQSYTVFVSVDGGPYDVWLRTDAVGASYTGEVGSTYAFFAVAQDPAGNREAAPTEPDAVTTVVSDVSAEGDPTLPTEFALGGNYPNPFNPTTTIRYDLPTTEHVTLEVYDIAGRRVAVLFDGEQAPGFHEVRWDARAFASGVYLYRLQAGSFRATKRMVLMR